MNSFAFKAMNCKYCSKSYIFKVHFKYFNIACRDWNKAINLDHWLHDWMTTRISNRRGVLLEIFDDVLTQFWKNLFYFISSFSTLKPLWTERMLVQKWRFNLLLLVYAALTCNAVLLWKVPFQFCEIFEDACKIKQKTIGAPAIIAKNSIVTFVTWTRTWFDILLYRIVTVSSAYISKYVSRSYASWFAFWVLTLPNFFLLFLWLKTLLMYVNEVQELRWYV